ncbi:MAG: hypothetical protein HZB53_06450 [Chloroflexi bacterium]|nr:hypothetical protein [Chloroflexota bacterium]
MLDPVETTGALGHPMWMQRDVHESQSAKVVALAASQGPLVGFEPAILILTLDAYFPMRACYELAPGACHASWLDKKAALPSPDPLPTSLGGGEILKGLAADSKMSIAACSNIALTATGISRKMPTAINERHAGAVV